VVAVGNRVLLYNADNGDLIESLRGHKDVVYCVDFSSDGSRFASGGADNVVVIWKITGQGLLKYNHTAPIQRVKYSPTTLQLASCSDVDFGLWTPEQKAVVKEKVSARILSAAWSSDGTMLAIGMLNGMISIRNQQAEETHRIERRAPIWCLTFIPNTIPGKAGGTSQGSASAGEGEMLAVGCWDKTLTMYRLLSAGAHKSHVERPLRYYPCSISLAGSGSNKSHYLIISGSNKKVLLYSKEGIRLSELASKDSWIWSCACQPGNERVIVGADSGSIDLVQMNFDTVHTLFREKYAFRESLTDIVIHHLVGDRKVRIKCKDLIQRISLYKNKLAVQLSDKVCVYESNAEEVADMHFRARKERMTISDKQCDLMAVTSSHLLFCRGAVLECYTFEGQRQRVWQMDSAVRFMKVEGGPEGREAILLCLESGLVCKVYVDNPFPLELTNRGNAVISADLSLYRTKLATVDSANVLTVTDLRTQEALFTARGVMSVCFNTEVDDMLCYTSETSMYVVPGLGASPASEPQEQHTPGLAIGFQGQKIFCLYRGGILGIDVPQGANIQRALETGDMRGAYGAACLGATEADWKLLAIRSLRANSLLIAKNAFARLKDAKFLSLIEVIERGSSSGQANDVPAIGEGKRSRIGATSNAPSTYSSSASSPSQLEPMWQAELLAYEGHHHEAAKTYARTGKVDEAIRLFTDLRRWNEAKMFAQNAGQADFSHLTIQQGKWLQEINDWKGASELFLSMGQHFQAAKIIVEAADVGWQAVLIDVVRAAPSDSKDALSFSGDAFANADEDAFAREAYEKAGDITKLMALYARRQMWAEAAKLADEHDGKFDVSVFLPYAEWLVAQDRYEDAMQAFKKAGRRDLSRRVLEELTFNAVSESRFKDAAYYFWMLSKESEGDDPAAQAECERKADLYFAYASIHAYVTEPFTSHPSETLFQVSRFIINSLGSADVVPFGVSKASTLYTLARQAMTLGAFKLARHAYDRLGKLQIPARRQAEVELDMLIIQAKPVRDDPDHLPVCYRCGSTNPLLNPFTNKFAKGDVCTNCGHPFVRSFINFDVLPLVEFVPEPSISDEEAIELIRQPPPNEGGKRGSGRGAASSRSKNASASAGRKWKEGKEGEADTLTLDAGSAYDDDFGMGPGGAGDADLFARCLNFTLESQVTSAPPPPPPLINFILSHLALSFFHSLSLIPPSLILTCATLQNNSYVAITVDTNTLLSMRRAEVFVCRPSSKKKRATFYRNMLPDIAIAISQPCHRFFHLEDFEFAYLSSRSCPYSRLRNVLEYGSL